MIAMPVSIQRRPLAPTRADTVSIGMYRGSEERPDPALIYEGRVRIYNVTFYFLLGRSSMLTEFTRDPRSLAGHTITRLDSIPVPERWRREMKMLFDMTRVYYDSRLGYVGKITMSVFDDGLAKTFNYGPKSAFHNTMIFGTVLDRAAPGFGYLAECMAVSALDKSVTHISTTEIPSKARRGQLERVGLQINVPTPREAWMRGLMTGLLRSQ